MVKVAKKQFSQLGEHPLLNFCNTLVLHESTKEDRLSGPKDDEDFVCNFFSINQKFDLKQHNDLIELRSLLTNYFHDLIGLKKTDTLARLNNWLSEHTFILQINNELKSFYSSPKKQTHFAPFIESLHSLLNELDIKRLKQCANPNCSHLFYDISKNNKRQWCSMSSCGNIMKARAFYARKRMEK